MVGFFASAAGQKTPRTCCSVLVQVRAVLEYNLLCTSTASSYNLVMERKSSDSFSAGKRPATGPWTLEEAVHEVNCLPYPEYPVPASRRQKHLHVHVPGPAESR